MKKNLDDRSDKCIIIGNNEESKAYRLYNPITNKYNISRYVELKEEEALDVRINKFVAKRATLSHGNDNEDEKEV